MKKIDTIFDPVLEYHLEYYLASKAIQESLEVSPLTTLRAIGTVRLGFGRQIGKTSYIARTARHNDVILSKDTEASRIMKLRTSAFGHSGCERLFTFGMTTVISGSVDTVQDVWIDDASYMDDETLSRLYVAFAGKCRRFILIG